MQSVFSKEIRKAPAVDWCIYFPGFSGAGEVSDKYMQI